MDENSVFWRPQNSQVGQDYVLHHDALAGMEAATRLMRGDQGVARLGWENGGTNPRIFKLRDQAGPGT